MFHSFTGDFYCRYHCPEAWSSQDKPSLLSGNDGIVAWLGDNSGLNLKELWNGLWRRMWGSWGFTVLFSTLMGAILKI